MTLRCSRSSLCGLSSAASLGTLVLGAGCAIAADGPIAMVARPETGGTEQRSSEQRAENLTSDRPAEVIIAAPVGTVSFGRTVDIIGKTTYSAHTRVAGTASLISLSYKPFPVVLSSAASIPTVSFLARYRITSPYGFRRDPFGGGGEFHPGIDLAAAAGSPIRATSDGVVGVAGWAGGYGQMVALELGGGVEARYGHMSRLNVTAGQQVHQGDVLGFVGSTGRSTGAHLHYEVRVNGRPVNPANR